MWMRMIVNGRRGMRSWVRLVGGAREARLGWIIDSSREVGGAEHRLARQRVGSASSPVCQRQRLRIALTEAIHHADRLLLRKHRRQKPQQERFQQNQQQQQQQCRRRIQMTYPTLHPHPRAIELLRRHADQHGTAQVSSRPRLRDHARRGVVRRQRTPHPRSGVARALDPRDPSRLDRSASAKRAAAT